MVRRSFHHHHLHCFQSEPNQTKASQEQKKLPFDVKAVQESQSASFLYSPKPLFPLFFQDYNRMISHFPCLLSNSILNKTDLIIIIIKAAIENYFKIITYTLLSLCAVISV